MTFKIFHEAQKRRWRSARRCRATWPGLLLPVSTLTAFVWGYLKSSVPESCSPAFKTVKKLNFFSLFPSKGRFCCEQPGTQPLQHGDNSPLHPHSPSLVNSMGPDCGFRGFFLKHLTELAFISHNLIYFIDFNRILRGTIYGKDSVIFAPFLWPFLSDNMHV